VILAQGLPGKDRKFIDPFPRPETAMDRYRSEKEAGQVERYDQRIQDVVAEAQARWRAQQAETSLAGLTDSRSEDKVQQEAGSEQSTELGDQ
jgi:hypothetical protein